MSTILLLVLIMEGNPPGVFLSSEGCALVYIYGDCV